MHDPFRGFPAGLAAYGNGSSESCVDEDVLVWGDRVRRRPVRSHAIHHASMLALLDGCSAHWRVAAAGRHIRVSISSGVAHARVGPLETPLICAAGSRTSVVDGTGDGAAGTLAKADERRAVVAHAVLEAGRVGAHALEILVHGVMVDASACDGSGLAVVCVGAQDVLVAVANRSRMALGSTSGTDGTHLGHGNGLAIAIEVGGGQVLRQRVVGREACRRRRRRLRRQRRGAAGAGRLLGRSQRRHPLEPGQARDAVGALSLEAGGRGVVLVAAAEEARVEMAAMAVLDGGRRQGRQRRGGARGRAAGSRACQHRAL